ncbi:MAG: hypothetical protein CMH48_13615 [Muricauda sp.]|nr:hypothetical protein [Allomuricauda sp.]MAU26766.1 hypothetical protein [Allomuricauda sp.]MBC31867.1 hypothetical protein [Allomuricauda sp.]|tara:strand:- start:110 stop:490 length:381 start_codon:yes stop_codon:yes gene_type:complete
MLHSKFWQAFFALAPILIGVLSIGFWMYFVVNLITNIETAEASGGEVEASMILGNIAWFVIVIMLIILISLSSLVFYIVHAVQNPNLKGNSLLVVWILLFVFVSGIGQLIYWLVEIVGKRNDPKVE